MIIKQPRKGPLSDVGAAMDIAQRVLRIPEGTEVSFTIYANFYGPDGTRMEFRSPDDSPLEGIQLR